MRTKVRKADAMTKLPAEKSALTKREKKKSGTSEKRTQVTGVTIGDKNKNGRCSDGECQRKQNKEGLAGRDVTQRKTKPRLKKRQFFHTSRGVKKTPQGEGQSRQRSQFEVKRRVHLLLIRTM